MLSWRVGDCKSAMFDGRGGIHDLELGSYQVLHDRSGNHHSGNLSLPFERGAHELVYRMSEGLGGIKFQS